jgi:Fe-S-cluster containining protein
MSPFKPVDGPLAGTSVPLHGGRPDSAGCNGCIDCCHLPEISVTDEEADRLRTLALDVPDLRGDLVISPDSGNEGWQIMQGPCPFRQPDSPLAEGGCRIYEDRPVGCAIFTCRFLLERKRERGFIG